MPKRQSEMARLAKQLQSLKMELRTGSRLIKKREFVIPDITTKLRGERWVRFLLSRPASGSEFVCTITDIFKALGLEDGKGAFIVSRVRVINPVKLVTQPTGGDVVNTGSCSLAISLDESPGPALNYSTEYSAAGDEGATICMMEIELGRTWRQTWWSQRSVITIFKVLAAAQGNTDSDSIVVDCLIDVIVNLKPVAIVTAPVEREKLLEVFGIRCLHCMVSTIYCNPRPGVRTGDGFYHDKGEFMCEHCGPGFDGESLNCRFSSLNTADGCVSTCDTYGPHTRCYVSNVMPDVEIGSAYEVIDG